MHVILFRHGPARRRDPERWPDDGERPLTSIGAQLARAAAEGLVRIEREIEQVVSSPVLRARQTARVLADVLDTGEVEELDALRPDGSMADLLQFLSARTTDRSLVLVGHEPGLGILAGLLLSGSPAGLKLKKAGACAVCFEGAPRKGGGRLSWFLPPRILRGTWTGARRP